MLRAMLLLSTGKNYHCKMISVRWESGGEVVVVISHLLWVAFVL